MGRVATIIIFWFVAGAWASTPQDASGASHTPTSTEDSLVESARDADVVYVFTVPARPPGVIRPEREWRRITVEAKAMTDRRRAQGLDVDNMSDETVVLPAVQHEEPPIPMRAHTTGSPEDQRTKCCVVLKRLQNNQQPGLSDLKQCRPCCVMLQRI